jgi:hypothetical protein
VPLFYIYIIIMEKIQIHLDTATTGNVTGNVPTVTFINNNKFNGKYSLVTRNRLCSSVALLNSQIPIGFYNVRGPYNTITDTSGIVYTITPGNYTSITALNAATFTGGAYPTSTALSTLGSFGTGTSILTWSPTAAVTGKSLGPATQNSLLSFLGYTSTASNSAKYPYTLNWDTYISMFIENLGTSSSENSQITFKIPLNTITNNVAYWSENSQNRQQIDLSYNLRLDYINFSFIDRFGNFLDANGFDWSATLEFTIAK